MTTFGQPVIVIFRNRTSPTSGSIYFFERYTGANGTSRFTLAALDEATRESIMGALLMSPGISPTAVNPFGLHYQVTAPASRKAMTRYVRRIYAIIAGIVTAPDSGCYSQIKVGSGRTPAHSARPAHSSASAA